MNVVVPAWIFRNKRANNEMRRLRELNAQLLAAVRVAVELFEDECTPDELGAYGWVYEARAAIAAAEEEVRV